ncbi:MAG: tetratricopeptide repeat protein, partial [Planctomycetes bacterium]|nr:tetratricopeptide repeat protein [Planctomycetota bacterium]
MTVFETLELERCSELRLLDAEAAHRLVRDARERSGQWPAESAEILALEWDAIEAACLRNLDRNEEAAQLARKVAASSVSGSEHARATALCVLGTQDIARGELDSARRHFDEGLRLTESLADPLLEANLLAMLGTSYLLQDRFLEAQRHLTRSVHSAPPNSLLIPTALGTLGGVLGAIGDHEGAARAYSEALQRNERAGNRRGMAWARHNLAATLCNAQRLNEAEESNRVSLALLEGDDGGPAVRDAQLPGYAWLLQARIRSARNDVAGALESAEKALSWNRESGDPIRLGNALQRKGECLRAAGDLQAALDCYAQSLECHSDARLHVEAYVGRARALSQLGRQSDAARALDQADTLTREKAHVGARIEFLRAAVEVHEHAGRLDRALECQRELHDSVVESLETTAASRIEQARLENELERLRSRAEALERSRADLKQQVTRRTADLRS